MNQANKSYTKLLAIALLAGSTVAHAAEDIAEALAGGKKSANLQLRHENVKNSGKTAPNKADATTVSLRLGYETGTFNV